MLEKRHTPVPWTGKMTRTGLILEAWAEGWFVGFVVVLISITIANMNRRRVLHYLILIELFLVIPRSCAIFSDSSAQNYLVAAFNTLNYIGYLLHGVIAWYKIKPFLRTRYSRLFIGLVALTTPFWVVHTYANWAYYIDGHKQPWSTTRALYVPFREPFWIFAGLNLVYNIKKRYNFSVIMLVKVAPRFGVMLTAMFLSVAFAIMDMTATVHPFGSVGLRGVGPFWKLARAFCCLTDVIVLDDFKTALDKIRDKALSRSTDLSSTGGWKMPTPINGTQHSKGVPDTERGDSDVHLNDLDLFRRDLDDQPRRTFSPLAPEKDFDPAANRKPSVLY